MWTLGGLRSPGWGIVNGCVLDILAISRLHTKGLLVGLSVGTTLCVLFSSYALAFWYGAKLVGWALAPPPRPLVGRWRLGLGEAPPQSFWPPIHL